MAHLLSFMVIIKEAGERQTRAKINQRERLKGALWEGARGRGLIASCIFSIWEHVYQCLLFAGFRFYHKGKTKRRQTSHLIGGARMLIDSQRLPANIPISWAWPILERSKCAMLDSIRGWGEELLPSLLVLSGLLSPVATWILLPSHQHLFNLAALQGEVKPLRWPW